MKMRFDLSGALSLMIGLLLLALQTTTVSCKKGDHSGYKTIYTCEGKTLHIVCNESVIHLIRANYGRFSISICNDQGNLEWRVNCMSQRSFLIMQDRCNLKPNCSIHASGDVFDDPCPGTRKYLEVQYHCGSETPVITSLASSPSTQRPGMTTNTSISPLEERSPIFTPPSSTINTSQWTRSPTLLTTLRPSTVFKIIPFSTVPISTTTKEPVLPNSTVKGVVDTTKFHYEMVQPTKSSTNPTLTFTKEHYCVPRLARGINWTWTNAGETAVVKCPDGASGNADWHCSIDPVMWTPDEPNLEQCRSLWIENIKRMMEHDSIISVTTELAHTSLAKPLFSADLKEIGELLQQALYKGVASMENVLDQWHRYHVLRELLQSLVQTLSNLLDEKQKDAWNDLETTESKSVISSLLETLEESALLLAETTSQDGSFSLVKKNILFSLKVFGFNEEIFFPIIEDIASEREYIHWIGIHDQISLPAQDLRKYAHHGLVKVVFVNFKHVNELLNPGTNILHYHRSQEMENVTRMVNSRVIAASLDRNGNPTLIHPAVITLRHIHEENMTNPICVFWDFHSRDWSARGCWVETSNRTHTVCACDHLTNFAVIMELSDTMDSDAEQAILNIVISVGCIIAAIFLLITVVILYSIGKNCGSSITIQKNMFLCLFISETIFVAGIDQTSHHITCALIAGALQYFFLAAFSWMFFECYQQYVALICSTDVEERCQDRYYYIVAYTLPAIVVIVSAAIDPSSYGTADHCWLHTDNYFVFSFVGPAVAIILGGIVFLGITICIFWHHTSLSTATKGKEESKLSNIRALSGRSITFITAVSLTWTSGLLYISNGSSILAYSFSVFNGILGLSAFILYCLRSDRVKEDYKEMIKNQPLFSWCHSPKNKEQESQNAGMPAPNKASPDHISQQYWNSGVGKSPRSKKSTLQGRISTIAARNLEVESPSAESNCDVGSSERNWSTIRNSHWKSPTSSSGESFEPDKDALSQQQEKYRSYRAHQHYRHFAISSDLNNQFVDHIYETIDDEPTSFHNKEKSVISQHFPPAENYYGDHSDLSQHSSSSYGYDQRPLLVAATSVRNVNSPQSIVPGEYSDSQDTVNKANTSTFASKELKFQVRSNKLCQPCSVTKKMVYVEGENGMGESPQNYIKTTYGESLSPSMPDLLHCPAENAAILAVLDGDKVVSQIQQEDHQTSAQPKYKLSTYC